jgi:hypothetical protein
MSVCVCETTWLHWTEFVRSSYEGVLLKSVDIIEYCPEDGILVKIGQK